jgi:hypothetical protein
MTKPNISAALTPAQKTTLKSNVDANKAIISPFAVNLTPQQRKEGQKLGTNSVSYGQTALETAQLHPAIIPADFVIAEFEKDVKLFFDLDEIDNHHSDYIELIRDTKLAVGMEVMEQANRLYAQAKLAAKHNAALDGVLAELGKRYKALGKRSSGTTFSVASKGFVEVDKIVPNSRFINAGTTILILKAGSDLANKVKLPPIPVNPGDSVQMPAGYSSIIVENVSETTAGSFIVRVK